MKILVVAAGAFAPANIIGAIRWTKICKYLAMRGHNISVIAQNSRTQVQDMLLMKDAHCCEVNYLDAGWIEKCLKRIYIRMGQKKEESAEQAIRTYYNATYSVTLVRLLNCLGFAKETKKYIEKNTQDADIVISTNPISAHWGAMRVARKLRIPWIADFRDPLYTPGGKSLYNRIMAYWQDRICSRADAIIAVSKGLREVLCQNREAYLKKTHVIYNGYDAADRPEATQERDDKFVRFVYTGILYTGKRDLTPVFTALKALCDEGVVQKENLIFDYAGTEYEILRKQASQADMDCILRDHGFVSRSDSLKLQQNADVLVMATYNDEGNPGVMPGKLYEYMMFQKPILAVVSGQVRGSELKEVIEECDVGYCHETSFDEPAQLKAFLQELILARTRRAPPAYAYRTQRFEYETLAGEVERLIENQVKR